MRPPGLIRPISRHRPPMGESMPWLAPSCSPPASTPTQATAPTTHLRAASQTTLGLQGGGNKSNPLVSNRWAVPYFFPRRCRRLWRRRFSEEQHKGCVIGAVGAFFNAIGKRIICIMLSHGLHYRSRRYWTAYAKNALSQVTRISTLDSLFCDRNLAPQDHNLAPQPEIHQDTN